MENEILMQILDEVKGIKVSVSGLETTVAGLETTVSKLETSVSKLEEGQEEIREDISMLRSAIHELETNQVRHDKRLLAISGDVRNIKTDVAVIKKNLHTARRIGDAAHDDIENLSKRLTYLET